MHPNIWESLLQVRLGFLLGYDFQSFCVMLDIEWGLCFNDQNIL